MRLACCIALALVAGCADNAILEVELGLPAASADVQYVLVQARSGEANFDDTWSGGATIDGISLGATRRKETIGIEADDAGEITAPLALKIRYCTSERCTEVADGDAQEVRVRIERAFYEGRYTRLDLVLPDVGDCSGGCPLTVDVPKCMVGGCRAGHAVTYCDSDMRHFCEQ